MDIIIFGIACLLLFSTRGKISELRDEIDSLKRRLKVLETVGSLQATKEPEQHQPAEAPPASPWNQPQVHIIDIPQPVYEPVPEKQKQFAETVYYKEEKAHVQHDASLEQQFGTRLPVWIGGIALALAGFYFVKYSIDAGWLRPAVRLTIEMIAGIAMIAAGHVIRNKPGFANGTRISQALTGAGIAALYVCTFAATDLYHLIPSTLGFTGMAIVTAAAVILSLRHGAPIALLGLIGGFLTPALIGSTHPSAPTLFIYLYFIFTGLMMVIRKQGWWLLAMLAVAASFLWVLIWLVGGSFSVGDTLYLGLFLAAVSFTTIGMAHGQQPADDEAEIFSTTTMAGALVLMGFVADKGGFGYLEWSLFGLLAAGGIVMAFFDQAQYGRIPLLSAIVNAIMLACWNFYDPQGFALVLGIYAVLYVVSGYILQSRSNNPLQWARLSSAAGIGYYLLGYFKLHHRLTIDIPHFWGFLALALAALSIKALTQIIRDVPEDHAQKQHLMAVFAATATAFISIGLCVEIDRAFLPVAFAGEVLALAWINTKVGIQALRKITAIIAAVFGFLISPQIILMLQLAVYSVFDEKLYPYAGLPSANGPLFHLGLPALMFLGASLLLRREKDSFLVKAFEVTAIILAGMTGYYLARQLMHPGADVLFIQAGFTERAIITNLIFACGFTCLWLGGCTARNTVSLCGLLLSIMATLRVGYFDLFLHNPLWNAQDVGTQAILNALLLTYGAPVFWIYGAIKNLPAGYKQPWEKGGFLSMLVLSFSLISFEVRQFFHGAFLNEGGTTNAEIYSYSAVWLLFGVALLFFGTLRRNKIIRVASLAVMILTIGKVFLYDASELTGLLRVFSFAGLGLSLLGLSWFYTRFVFRGKEGD